MLAYGKLPRDGERGVLGFEFSGTDAGGRRVMGSGFKAMATKVIAYITGSGFYVDSSQEC